MFKEVMIEFTEVYCDKCQTLIGFQDKDDFISIIICERCYKKILSEGEG